MNELLSQLMQLGPGVVQGLKGNGLAMQQFLDSYHRTNLLLEQRERQKNIDALSQQDHARQITRQEAMDQRQRDADARNLELQKLGVMPQLAEMGAAGETPDDAKHIIETAIPGLMKAFGQDTMAMGQPAVDMATRTITARQKRQVGEFVEKALKTDFVANNPDADPVIDNLPEHVTKALGKPTARLSELQQFAQLPVGKPAGKPSDEVSWQIKEGIGPDGKPGMFRINPKTGETQPLDGIRPEPPKPVAGDEPIAVDDVAGAAAAIIAGRMAPSQLSLVGGMGNRGVKFKQAVVAEVNKQNPTFNWQQAESGYQFGKSPATQTTVRYLDNVAKTIPMLREANKVFKRSNVRFVNDVLKSGKSQFGDISVADFDFKSTLLADEIAKVLQGGGTGSGTSDAKLKQAQELLNGNLTPQQFETVLDAAEEMLKVRRDTLTAGTFMSQPETSAKPKFTVGQKVRNKKTGEVREVTGVQPDGTPILGPVKQ